MSIPAGNGATGAPGTRPALGYLLNLLWFNSLFMLISENNMNTCTYLIHTLSLIMKLIVIFGIKIYRRLPIILTASTFPLSSRFYRNFLDNLTMTCEHLSFSLKL
jgi:hypothetical protein